MKKIIKFTIIVTVILFLLTFINRNNYYENSYILSDDSIKKFEEDLKNGKKINPSNYIPRKKDYKNKISIFTIKISKSIEFIVNHSLKKAFDYLDN